MRGKLIILISFILISFTLAAKESVLKIICDQEDANIYINGKFATRYSEKDVSINLGEGKYKLEIRKDLDDGSYYFYEKDYEFGEYSVRIIADVQMKIKYTEKYYYKNAKMTKNISYYEEYLENYPNGSYSEEFNKFLEEYYVANSNDMENCKKYIEKYPKGKNIALMKASLESLYFEKFIKNNNISYGEEYIDKYPDGKFVDRVKKVIDELKPKGIIDVYPKEFHENQPMIIYFSANKSQAIWKYRKALNRKNPNIDILPSQVFIRFGFNGWMPQYLTDEKNDPAMDRAPEMGVGVWKYALGIPLEEEIKEINITFKDEFNNWDTNLAKDYTIYLKKEGTKYIVTEINR